MILTKKYRLIWDSDNTLVSDPEKDYTGTQTVVGEGMQYFESDNLEDIYNMIKNRSLIKPSDMI